MPSPAQRATLPTPPRPRRSVVLVGMPGAGKSAIGRRLALRLDLPFHDADAAIEAAAGQSVADIFSRYGEPHFRDGERRVIARLLAGPPIVLATGGGAYADAATRNAMRNAGAVTIWLRCPLPVLLRRVAGREHRPMFRDADPAEVLQRLMAARHPLYAEADIVIACSDESAEQTTANVASALDAFRPPHRLPVRFGAAGTTGAASIAGVAGIEGGPSVLGAASIANAANLADAVGITDAAAGAGTTGAAGYDVLVGPGLLARAGGLLAPLLPARRCVVVTDANVALRHLPTLRESLEEAGFAVLAECVVAPGEPSKSMAELTRLLEAMLTAGADRRTAVLALGGGVVGDLAGFAAAVALRGLPFVQLPTTLLAQVDSSVGGKTGVNLSVGKNLAGAFHQPRLVLADTAALATLPARELRAGYAEVAKHGLLAGDAFWAWCEANGPAAVAGDPDGLTHAVLESCRLKAAVVAADEREESAEGGRALLNLGHTFGHALEAETGYGDALLHGEAVAVGLVLAVALSARLGHCAQEWPGRVAAHLASCGLPAGLGDLDRRFSAAALLARMRRDKKARDGRLRFVLFRAPGDVFTANVDEATVLALLRDAGCGD